MGDSLLDAAAAPAVVEVAAADGLVTVEDATDNDDTAMEGEVGATGDDWADDAPGTAAVAAAVAAANAAWVLSMMRPSPSCSPMSPSSANALSAAPGLTHAFAAASAPPLAGSSP
jgi:hypothetical protein